MDLLAAIVAAAVAFGSTFWAGRVVGVKCRTWPAWRYWAANAAGLLVGVAVGALGLRMRADWLWMAGLGVMAGSVSGLKYGLGRVVNQWRDQRDEAE